MNTKQRFPDVFLPFRNRHAGQSFALLGTGPTVLQYRDDKQVIKIGCNELAVADHVELDYYFIGDPQLRRPNKFLAIYQEVMRFRPRIQKFMRHHMPPGMLHTLYYYTTDGHKLIMPFRADIDRGLAAVASISFEMLQFALYAGAARIYLVGHDCSYRAGTFRTPADTHQRAAEKGIPQYWQLAKRFMAAEYPDVEVRIVNPVVMRVFPEIDQAEIVENE